MSRVADAPRAIDANVILRYLLDDLPDQSQRARRLVDSETPLGLTAVALAEAAWTMTSARRRIDQRLVARALLDLLARENVVPIGFERRLMQNALELCAADAGAADFGDALIAASCQSAGVHEIFTFDQRFARTGLASILPP